MIQIKRSEYCWRIIVDGASHEHCLEAIAANTGFRVTDAASIIGISEQHLRRVFHRDVGICIKDWMKYERMVIARKLLISGVPQREISPYLGFSHINSFQREFRRVYQMNVSDFLKTFHLRNEMHLQAHSYEEFGSGCTK